MAWKETHIMDQKTEFALRAVRGLESFQELCQEFQISRKTGYKWKNRFLQQGLEGLQDQSRRPITSPTGLTEDVVCRIVELKQAHPSWGARKLLALMERCPLGLEIPSESSIKRVLEKAGLVKHRRRRAQQDTGRLQCRVKSERPNHIWTIDFKGWWRTRDQHRFEPLTIRDDFSRFILCAQSLAHTRTEFVRARMETLFSEHGLPEIIRSDNGSPFASSNSVFGLTRLSSWWLALGIDLDRINPGKPQENGAHERMHRDMAEDLGRTPEQTSETQQAALDTWRTTFNWQRPHASLDMRFPSDVYESSSRRFDPADLELTYPIGMLTRRVQKNGDIKLSNRKITLSSALSTYNVGLESQSDRVFTVWFGRLALGTVDLSTESFTRAGP